MIGIAEQLMLYLHGVLGTVAAVIIWGVTYLVYRLFKGAPTPGTLNIEPLDK